MKSPGDDFKPFKPMFALAIADNLQYDQLSNKPFVFQPR
jgi:hypothetical protein